MELRDKGEAPSTVIQISNKDNLEQKEKKCKDGKNVNLKLPFHKHHDVPDTNLLLACLVILCFNPVLGACAAYFSISAAGAYRDGHAKRGDKKAFISVVISLTGIVLTVVLVMSIVLWLAVSGIRVKV